MLTREKGYFPPSIGFLGRLGRSVIFSCRNIGLATILLLDTFISLKHLVRPRVRREAFGHMFVMGIKSLGVVTVVALFTGMILAIHTGIELRKFNQEVNIGSAVMLSLLRDMGPIMTALILTACVGSAIAAQIGTMVVSEEIAALDIMSIDPVRFLVMPRMVAMAIMTPALTFYSVVIGLLGGGIVGLTQLGVSWTAYINNAILYAEVKDLYVGIFKAFVFGIVITLVACHEGFATTQGAVGVGQSTRRAVIVSFLLILILGYYITRMFYIS